MTLSHVKTLTKGTFRPRQRLVLDLTALTRRPAGATVSLDPAFALAAGLCDADPPVTFAVLTPHGLAQIGLDVIETARSGAASDAAGLGRGAAARGAFDPGRPSEARLGLAVVRAMPLAEIVRLKAVLAADADAAEGRPLAPPGPPVALAPGDVLVAVFDHAPEDAARLDALRDLAARTKARFVALAPDPRPLDAPHLFAPAEIDALAELWGELPWMVETILCVGEAAAAAGQARAAGRPASVAALPDTVTGLARPVQPDPQSRIALCAGPIGDAGRQACLVAAALAAFADGRLTRGRDRLVLAGPDAQGGAALRARLARHPDTRDAIEVDPDPPRDRLARRAAEARLLVETGVPGWGGWGAAAAAAAGRPLLSGLDLLDLRAAGAAVAAGLDSPGPVAVAATPRDMALAALAAIDTRSGP